MKMNVKLNLLVPNIRYFKVMLPFEDKFWSVIPILNYLKILYVSSQNDIDILLFD
jgi:hypothetical protein